MREAVACWMMGARCLRGLLLVCAGWWRCRYRLGWWGLSLAHGCWRWALLHGRLAKFVEGGDTSAIHCLMVWSEGLDVQYEIDILGVLTRTLIDDQVEQFREQIEAAIDFVRRTYPPPLRELAIRRPAGISRWLLARASDRAARTGESGGPPALGRAGFRRRTPPPAPAIAALCAPSGLRRARASSSSRAAGPGRGGGPETHPELSRCLRPVAAR